MKKQVINKTLALQPTPKLIVSCCDKEGRNNALVVGFAANVSFDPPIIMVGIVPDRYSHHIIKESGCFVVNLVSPSFSKEYEYLGSHSGKNEDKFDHLNIKFENGCYVNAPLLTECPVCIECTVIDSIQPGTHELFFGRVDCVHCDQEYLNENGNIDWSKINLL
jgi:flavin reductase (DIM6/NTAB) family NADH-FMN oxidoreductase RutF